MVSDEERRLDRRIAAVLWTVAVACIALAWNATFPRLGLLLAFVALFAAVWGWNLWNDKYSHEGDSLIERFGRSLPWIWWLR